MEALSTSIRVLALAQNSAPYWTLDRILGFVANLAIVFALLIAARQLWLTTGQFVENRRSQKASRTFDFLRRWNDIDFAKYRTPVYDFLETNPTFLLLDTRINRDSEFKAALRLTLNFYEEMAILYNRNEIDREICVECFEGQIKFLYRHTSTYIQNMRTKYEVEKLLTEFTRMWQDVQSRTQ